MKVTAVLLAAGQGTRMKSDLPKMLHPVCGAHRPTYRHGRRIEGHENAADGGIGAADLKTGVIVGECEGERGGPFMIRATSPTRITAACPPEAPAAPETKKARQKTRS